MAQRYMETVLTPAVKAAQERFYHKAEDYGTGAPELDPLTPREHDFITTRDSFYMATVNEDGWPYVQHRGGPAGFLKVLDASRMGFADYRGNRQLLSVGNLSQNNRVSLFLMDYPAKARLKILGHVHVISADEDPELFQQIVDPEMARRVERGFIIDVLSYDWNCPQYITPRYTAEQIAPSVDKLKARIAELEEEFERLK